MKIYRIVVAVLALGMLFPLPRAAEAGLKAEVDPKVWQDTAKGQSADFLVILRSQAGLSALEASPAGGTGRVTETFQALRQAASASQPSLEAALRGRGTSYRSFWIVNMLSVRGGLDLVNFLAARPEVAYVEPDRPFKVNLEMPGSTPQLPGLLAPSAAPQPGLTAVHAPDLWALGFTGQGIVYATADTGVQWDHPALKAQYRGWNGTQADHNYNWWDAIKTSITGGSNPCGINSQQPCDDYGHGTHTTGTGVGADTANGPIGMAPGAKWIACRNMDNGVGRPSTYIDCLQFFIAPTDLNGQNPDPSKHADVISNSYGCPPSEQCSPHSLQAAVQAVRAAGIFMSVSAGNSGPSCSSITDPPGLESTVFTVGAVDPVSHVIASFSSRGPITIDPAPLMKPNIVAPGVGVYSAWIGSGYASLMGTSMAAPHVAGGVALLWSAFPELKNKIFATEALLKQSATPLTTSQGCGSDTPTSVPNNVYGYGLMNVLAAYNRQTSNPIVIHQIYLPVELK